MGAGATDGAGAGLIALTRGDRAQTRRRLTEAVAGWRRYLGHNAGAELVANFGGPGPPADRRPGRAGMELCRLTAELVELDELTEVP